MPHRVLSPRWTSPGGTVRRVADIEKVKQIRDDQRAKRRQYQNPDALDVPWEDPERPWLASDSEWEGVFDPAVGERNVHFPRAEIHDLAFDQYLQVAHKNNKKTEASRQSIWSDCLCNKKIKSGASGAGPWKYDGIDPFGRAELRGKFRSSEIMSRQRTWRDKKTADEHEVELAKQRRKAQQERKRSAAHFDAEREKILHKRSGIREVKYPPKPAEKEEEEEEDTTEPENGDEADDENEDDD